MGANAIEFYRKRKVTIICIVDLSKSKLTSLEGYTSTLTAKAYKDDKTAVITSEGEIVGLVITYVLTPTETDKIERIYHYDIVIDDSATDIHTVTQDTLRIKQSVSN